MHEEFGEGRWLGGDGQWHQGKPPQGWQQLSNLRWYPPAGTDQPDADTPPSWSGTGPAKPGRFGAWPLWARIGGPVTAVLLVVALAGALAAPDQPVTRLADDASPSTTERARRSTTTTVRVTTTAPTTTTTAPPPPPTVSVTVPPTEPPPVPEPAPHEPEPAPPPEEPSGGGCHPSYDPCVPYASDVDCVGGSGDGPEYTGTVSVIGPDVYDLDRDGDGIGCDP